MRARLYEALEGGAKFLALNLAKVHYIDSYGVGALLAAHTTAINAGRKCCFFGAPPAILAILTVARVIKVLHLFPDEASALSSLRGE